MKQGLFKKPQSTTKASTKIQHLHHQPTSKTSFFINLPDDPFSTPLVLDRTMKLALIGFVFLRPEGRFIAIISFHIRLCAILPLRQIGFVFSNVPCRKAAGFTNFYLRFTIWQFVPSSSQPKAGDWLWIGFVFTACQTTLFYLISLLLLVMCLFGPFKNWVCFFKSCLASGYRVTRQWLSEYQVISLILPGLLISWLPTSWSPDLLIFAISVFYIQFVNYYTNHAVYRQANSKKISVRRRSLRPGSGQA